MAGCTPIAQRLVPDGRHSNRHPRKSSLSLSLLSSLRSLLLHLLPSPFHNFPGEFVEIGSRGWKGHKEEETKCDELREGPKARKERDSPGVRKEDERNREKERGNGESDGMRNPPRQHPSRSLNN